MQEMTEEQSIEYFNALHWYTKNGTCILPGIENHKIRLSITDRLYSFLCLNKEPRINEKLDFLKKCSFLCSEELQDQR